MGTLYNVVLNGPRLRNATTYADVGVPLQGVAGVLLLRIPSCTGP